MSYSDAEHYVIRATREGRWAKLTTREEIRAELIRRLMLGLPPDAGEAPVPTPCGVRVTNAVITGRLNLNNGRGADGSVMPGLVLDNCHIAEGIDLSYAQLGKLSIEGSEISEVRAVRAVIQGEVIANDIRPAEPEGACFLSFYSARIDGDVQVRRARLCEPSTPDLFGAAQFAIDLRNAIVGGNVNMRYTDCGGTVNLALAIIEGNFTARGARLEPRPERAEVLIGDGVEIKGAVSLRCAPEGKRFEALGQISFVRASVAAMVLDGGVITPKNIDDSALNLESATIGGGIYMRNRFRLVGLLNMKRATLKGEIAAPGAMCTLGIEAVGLTVAGEADFSQVLTDDGFIDLSDAHIGSVLKIGGIKANIDLKRAHVETLDDLGDCWLDERLYIDGFMYRRLEHPRSNRSNKPIWKARLKWLSRQGLGYKYKSNLMHWFSGAPHIHVKKADYHPQPFLHLGRVLSDMGLDADSRRVMRAKQWIEARNEGFIVQPVMKLFGLCFGFGYSSKRAVVTLFLYFLLGWYGTRLAMHTGWLVYDIQPTAVYAAQRAEGNRSEHDVAVLPRIFDRNVTDQLPCQDVYAYSYALDLMVPLIDLHVEGKCEIRNNYTRADTFPAWPAAEAQLVRLYAALRLKPPHDAVFEGRLHREWPARLGWNFAHTAYALIGWLVVSLAILTFSGLLRQKEKLD